MELIYDWKNFDQIFYPARRKSGQGQGQEDPELRQPVYVMLQGDRVGAIYASHEDLHDFLGQPVSALDTFKIGRQVHFFKEAEFREWMTSVKDLPHLDQQRSALRLLAGDRATNKKHFLLAGIETWWRKFLPHGFGIWLRFDDMPGLGGRAGRRDFFLKFKFGKLESFQVPELSALGRDRVEQPDEVAKYLSERHLSSVQGFGVAWADWQVWTERADPWPLILKAMKESRLKLYPSKLSVKLMFWLRARLGF